MPDSTITEIADKALKWREVTPAGFIAALVIALLWAYHKFILLPFARFLTKRDPDG